jgi:hypothetical protein
MYMGRAVVFPQFKLFDTSIIDPITFGGAITDKK